MRKIYLFVICITLFYSSSTGNSFINLYSDTPDTTILSISSSDTQDDHITNFKILQNDVSSTKTEKNEITQENIVTNIVIGIYFFVIAMFIRSLWGQETDFL